MRSIDLALGGRASQAKDFEVRDLIIRDVDLRLTGQKVVAKTEKKKKLQDTYNLSNGSGVISMLSACTKPERRLPILQF
jgi:hypothetical protein